MTQRSTGPACGNNPNHRLSPGDRQTVDAFKAYLQQRAAIARVRQMADAWEQQLPETIRTATAVEAIRTALEPATVPPPAEEHRLALSQALGLGTGAPWDAVRERAAELAAADPHSCDNCEGIDPGTCLTRPKVDSKAADRAALRDRIAKALAGAELKPPFPHCLAMADAVLGVLPEPADRPAVLREATDAVFGLSFDELRSDTEFVSYEQAWNLGTIDASNLLRRLAGGAGAAEPPAAECSAQNRNYESGPRLCIRAAQHHGDHIDEHGFHWSDTVAVYPLADGTFRRGTDAHAELRRVADETPAATPTVADAQHMLTRMHADATTHSLDGALQIVAAWCTDAKKYSGMDEEELARRLEHAGYRLPAEAQLDGAQP